MKTFKPQFNKFTTLILSVLMVATLLFSACDKDDDISNSEAEAWDEILQEVDNNDDFSTLKAAIEAAGIRDSLIAELPLTLFAPTNDAFAEIGADTLAYLLETPVELTKLLNYHFIAGIIKANELTNGELTTLNDGETVTVEISNDEIMINEAKVIASSIEFSDGIVHTIDKVVRPDNLDFSGM